jgi:GTP:adenosylcobinamide-phosphate guanylyltransferase
MKILISHSWNDKSLATMIYEALQKDGHEVWFDIHKLIPGDNIQTVIDAYISKCDVMVLIWSIHAFASTGVEAEIITAKKLNKRIIPLQADTTPLNHNSQLKNILSIPFDNTEMGLLLLQRGLLLLMASDTFKEAHWFKECFDNVVDLGGYLNYVNTFRIKENKNDDGSKAAWVERLEELKTKNEYIRQQIMPSVNVRIEKLNNILNQMEHGNVQLEELEEWRIWCIENESIHPELIKKLIEFIDKDIKRIHDGGKPVSTINFEKIENAIERLENAIAQKKDSAYENMISKIKKYFGLFVPEKTIQLIVTGYLKYVIMCPKVLKELLDEAKLSEYVAVKEITSMLVQYLESQDHGLEMRKDNLDGYFDDAYIINNTVQLLIEADLVAKNNFTIDTISNNIVDKYVSFILNNHTKSKLDNLLLQMRELIGVKSNEINWNQVAALVIGAAAVSSGIPYHSSLQDYNAMSGNQNSGTGNENDSRCFEDKAAEFSAKYGLGLNIY